MQRNPSISETLRAVIRSAKVPRSSPSGELSWPDLISYKNKFRVKNKISYRKKLIGSARWLVKTGLDGMLRYFRPGRRHGWGTVYRLLAGRVTENCGMTGTA